MEEFWDKMYGAVYNIQAMDTELSPLDCLMPWAYVRQIFCFPSSSPLAPHTLRDGLAGIVRDIPYLASHVGRKASSPLGTAFSLNAPTQTIDDIFSWQDLSTATGVDSYSALKATHFAPARLSAIPGLTPPETDAPPRDTAPVLRARLTLLRGGGALLCVAVHHGTTDITGFGALLDLWATRCRTGSSSPGFQSSVLDRSLLARQAEEGGEANDGVPELLHVRGHDDAASATVVTTTTQEPHQKRTKKKEEEVQDVFETCIFHFPVSPLRALKTAVNAHLLAALDDNEDDILEAVKWVSTQDVLTAILWSAVVAAESESSGGQDSGSNVNVDTDKPAAGESSTSSGTSTIGIPVNFRAQLDLPHHYLGAAFARTAASAPRSALLFLAASSSLSSPNTPNAHQDAEEVKAIAPIATSVRRAIRRVDGPRVRAMLRYLYLSRARSLSGSKDPAENAPQTQTQIEFGPPRDLGASIVSWADQFGTGAGVPDWGPNLGGGGGWCEAVRTTRIPGRRWPVVLPRLRRQGEGQDEDGLEVLISLEKGAMRALKGGDLMWRWASVRCEGGV